MSDEQRKSDVSHDLAEQPDSIPTPKAKNGTALLKILSIIAPVWYIGWFVLFGILSDTAYYTETIMYVFFAAIVVYSIVHAIFAGLPVRRVLLSRFKIPVQITRLSLSR
jgi:hypothetical protein